ncbi:MAG: hypothetical protein IJX56_02890, partial [Alistipes sp.]|nr:hypothetical protein [Alistipes sp.]
MRYFHSGLVFEINEYCLFLSCFLTIYLPTGYKSYKDNPKKWIKKIINRIFNGFVTNLSAAADKLPKQREIGRLIPRKFARNALLI